jgi:ubiquinone/menaquinone biosynthesis C-methylase UbiE
MCLKKQVKKMGIETSSTSIHLLRQKYSNIKFTKAFCHNIPFKDDSYDFVYTFMVLCCIDRNNYLQSLGELLRVTKKFLMIVDFNPSKPHIRKYKHKKNFYVYKDDYDLILSKSGFLKKIMEKKFYINKKNEICIIDKKTKISKWIDDHARKITIYKKTITLKNK